MTTLVDNPSAESERPRVGIALAVAALCFGLGVGGVMMLATSPRTSERPMRSAPTSTPRVSKPEQPIPSAAVNAPTPSQVPSPPETAPSAEATATTAQAEPKTSVPAVGASPIEPHAVAEASSELTVIQGRVAYLRCDGLSTEGGRSPCPRDAALERAVWETLNGLPACTPSLGRGGADVRLDISRNQRTEARVIPILGSPEPTLDTQRVYACVGRSLAKLKPTLDPLYMMVSFRVALH